MDTFEKICDIIIENMGFDEDITFTEEMTFGEMELDSLDVVDCIMSIEDEFDITIKDEELQTVSTLGELTEIVRAKTAM
ncbi:MAG: acyl carrier protein [Ruminococcaceae bacterium]|nr:acyl carrier protein [Oscillospiraceae bacterium]MBQ9912894.1 acyl carrier protein [Clostridia bacterium]